MQQTQTATPRHITEALAAGISPAMLGALDAAAKRPCTPGEYYIWDGEQAEYAESYMEEAQARLATWIAAMMGMESYTAAAELAELQEGMADNEWHSRGGW